MSDDIEQQWLRDLPSDWTGKRADFLCNSRRVTVDPKCFGDDLVAHYSIPQVQETGGPLIEPASDINSTKLLIDSPILLVSKLNPRKKTICIAEPHPEHPTLASGEFVAINPDHMDRRYAYYLWCSEKVTDRLSAIVQSATRSHQRVNPADILKLPWKWPPLDTQRRIARFLDEKTSRIDSLIEKKRELLDRLAEKRQALITLGVTKGLNPAFHARSDRGGHHHARRGDRPLAEGAGRVTNNFEKQWLSDLLPHWIEKRADFLCNPYRVTVDPKCFGDDLVAHYSIPQVQETGGPLIEPASDINSTKLLIDSPILLVSKLNPRKKTICIAEPHPEHPTLASGEFVAINPDHMDRRYAYYLWCSEKVTDRLSAIVQSATRSHQRVNPADILKLPWKWPPLDTQRRIARFLDGKTSRIDGLMEKINCSIDYLEDYRSAIITATVTGQYPGLQ